MRSLPQDLTTGLLGAYCGDVSAEVLVVPGAGEPTSPGLGLTMVRSPVGKSPPRWHEGKSIAKRKWTDEEVSFLKEKLSQADPEADRRYLQKLCEAYRERFPHVQRTKVAIRARLCKLRQGLSPKEWVNRTRRQLAFDNGGEAALEVEEELVLEEETAQGGTEIRDPLMSGEVVEGDTEAAEPVECETQAGFPAIVEDHVRVRFASLCRLSQSLAQRKVTPKLRLTEPQLHVAQRLFEWGWDKLTDKSYWHFNCMVFALGHLFADTYPKLGTDRATETDAATNNTAAEPKRPCVQARTRDRIRALESTYREKSAEFRKQLNWVTVELARLKAGTPATIRQRKIIRRLKAKFHTLKPRSLIRKRIHLRDLVKRLKREHKQAIRKVRFQERNRQASAGTLARNLLRDKSGEQAKVKGPSKKAVWKFWSNIVGTAATYDPTSKTMRRWVRQVTPKVAMCEPDETARALVDDDMWKRVLCKLKAFKAPGPDCIRNSIYMQVPAVSNCLREFIVRMLDGEAEIPNWLMTGKTTLIHKGGETTDPANYRPIACLNTAYKIMTACLSDVLMRHTRTFGLLPCEQRSMRTGSWGTIECLLLDQTIEATSRSYKRPLSVAWVDFKKAFDLVPHEHLLCMLEAMKAPRVVTNTIRRVMPHWKTVFTFVSRGRPCHTEELSIVRGLFQGDSLSPLLFCLAIAPLSAAIRRRCAAYTIRDNETVSHLLYMDDLKVYSPTPKDLEKAIRVVERASRAIGMELGLRKCAIAHRNHRGQVEVHEEAESSYHGIPLLKEEDCYKYLGLQQLFRVNRSETGRQVLTKVNARVTELLKTDLNSANLTKALGCKIAGTMRYYIAAQVWTKGDMCTLDRQIRGQLRNTRYHDGASSTVRLYLPRRLGGRGIPLLEEVYCITILGLVDYLGKCLDGFGEQLWRCMYALETDRPGRRRQTVIGKARHVLSQLGLADDYLVEKQGLQLRRDDPDRKVSEYKAQIKRHFQAKAETELTGHVVHGRFYNLLKDERLERTLPHAWLVDGLLRPQTEGYIIAIQDGALLTKARRQVTTGRVATPRCRLCGEAPETISHIISSCSRHHHSAYKLRHDQALIPVLNALLQALGMGERICGERADPRPEYVCDRGSVLWDVMVQPDRKAYRPDMLVYDQEAKVNLRKDHYRMWGVALTVTTVNLVPIRVRWLELDRSGLE
eukprot:gene21421-biopygen13239